MGWPDPKVVISDTPPPVVQCRTEKEAAACTELIRMMQRGQEPVVFISRNVESGEIEVHGRSNQFTSVGHAMEVFDVAKAKLAHALFRRRKPARD